MNTSYDVPPTVEEACYLLESDGAHALAGGVAFTMALSKGQIQPGSIVSLAKLHGLRGVVVGAGLTIGAMTTHGELLRNPALAGYDPLLPLMFSDVGNVRVRAVGTLGGNLAYADPRHDPSPLLCALGAIVVLQSSRGTRRVLLESLAEGPFRTSIQRGELLTAVELPPRPQTLRSGWSKLQTSSLDDYASVSVAVAYEETGGQIANPRIFVGASDTHVHPLKASQCLAASVVGGNGAIGAKAVEAAADALEKEIQPKDDHRGSRHYKRQLVRVALVRAIARARSGGESQ
ncbi:FAD binding domain-containing protein [Arthrobacter sp. zg-Y1219]|uniref:FAD binding domain-containing protein n=1 Tax=Arthrobacter sp. zg-Y1219 TaxID=3049067 RepID=UPI0024C35CBC|nr:FAD binding domain-containing protein [Arthrobacter sp. zg-Y1219]MDK1361693.1 FAD binding domain-containing protein [Arthrobacter sp. zg-Y1219]